MHINVKGIEESYSKKTCLIHSTPTLINIFTPEILLFFGIPINNSVNTNGLRENF